jgi:hypothetical protein
MEQAVNRSRAATIFFGLPSCHSIQHEYASGRSLVTL